MYFKNSSLNYIPTTFGGEPKKKKHFPKMESASSEP
ncbi:TPA: hypothetical protein O6A06_002990 [Staphylococcus aureus]|nr:hypothetical protein [Staphylococcus aureus]ULV67016.1 hypothetical protein IF767_13430 [Staphylococcus aureus]HDB0628942.1 hypothetical protein [Staphylococcus aureus]HEJ7297422.1 hypothetical protein [Staphylococcus aureus]